MWRQSTVANEWIPLNLTFRDENCFNQAGDNVKKEEGELKERSHWRRSEESGGSWAASGRHGQRGSWARVHERRSWRCRRGRKRGFYEDAEFNTFAKKVMDDYIAFETRYGYRLNQRRFLKYLFIFEQETNTKWQTSNVLDWATSLQTNDRGLQ